MYACSDGATRPAADSRAAAAVEVRRRNSMKTMIRRLGCADVIAILSLVVAAGCDRSPAAGNAPSTAVPAAARDTLPQPLTSPEGDAVGTKVATIGDVHRPAKREDGVSSAPSPTDASGSSLVDTRPLNTQDTTAAGTPRNRKTPDHQLSPKHMAMAYQQIYCAQRRGEAAKLQRLYAHFGFSGPDAWRAAWQRASANPNWGGRVATAAWRLCQW